MPEAILWILYEITIPSLREGMVISPVGLGQLLGVIGGPVAKGIVGGVHGTL